MSSYDEGNEQQADEVCALQAIYGEDFVTQSSTSGSSFTFAIPEADAQPHLVLRVHLPETYPSKHPPIFELSCDFLPTDVLAGLVQELESMFIPGEVVLWNWIEHLKEQWVHLAPQQPAQHQSDSISGAAAETLEADAVLAAELQQEQLLAAQEGSKGLQGQWQQQAAAGSSNAELEAAMAELAPAVVHGEPYTEKKSTFQAHLAPVHSLQQVQAFVELLLQSNKVRQATHNIMAYRIKQQESAGFMQDYDDDGEAAAGGRLLHLLQMTDARNVCVVVSRWYGGILLGPARFGIITSTARQLLDACGYIAAKDPGGKGSSSKGKKR